MSLVRNREAPALVEWQDGVHMVGTPVWCDARHAREVCFLSSARAEAHSHLRVLATRETMKLLRKRPSRGSALTVPFGRPFALGELRLELFPSGRGPGAASLLVESKAGRVDYAGVVGRGGPLSPAAEIRACDAIVIDGSLVRPGRKVPPTEEVIADIGRWVDRVLAERATPVLLADPFGRAADLAHLLGKKHRLRVHRTIFDVLKRLRSLGVSLPRATCLTAAPAIGDVVIWPIDASAARSIRRPRLALVDGLALNPDATRRFGVEEAFPWSCRLGHDELLAYIEQTGARQVFLLGDSGGLPGTPLGQLRLF